MGRDMIQETRKSEANPWLERAGWSKYLKGLNRPELLECIREPSSDLDGEEGEKEVVEAKHPLLIGLVCLCE